MEKNRDRPHTLTVLTPTPPSPSSPPEQRRHVGWAKREACPSGPRDNRTDENYKNTENLSSVPSRTEYHNARWARHYLCPSYGVSRHPRHRFISRQRGSRQPQQQPSPQNPTLNRPSLLGSKQSIEVVFNGHQSYNTGKISQQECTTQHKKIALPDE